MFELFNPNGDLRISHGTLPHWFQAGATYFVTFRTEDSIPNDVADLWHRKRLDWLHRHGIDPKQPGWTERLEQQAGALLREYHDTFSREYLDSLDKGHGACVLRKRDCADIVAQSLKHFDNDRYHLGDFVVMPNHVHLLVGLLGTTDIEKQCFSWKKFSAGKLNKRLNRTGRFWQEESFDHLVRSADRFERLQIYIANNGPKAGLNPNEYLLWQRDQ